MNINQSQRPKINNNELFLQRLQENPPEYNIGDCVFYLFKKHTNGGIGYVAGRSFNESEKKWKYAVRQFGLNYIFDEIDIVSKYEYSRFA